MPTSNAAFSGWNAPLSARTPDTSLPPPTFTQPLPATSLGSTDSLMASLPFAKPFKQQQQPSAVSSSAPKFNQPQSVAQRPSFYQQQQRQQLHNRTQHAQVGLKPTYYVQCFVQVCLFPCSYSQRPSSADGLPTSSAPHSRQDSLPPSRW